MTLDRLRPGQRCRVVGFSEDTPVSRRLTELGIVSGRAILYLRDAPLLDPLEIKIGNSFLSLRRSEAAKILVVPEEV